ncbi:hypothetical protein [uncultured Microbacterium sp.]|uniref:hypothetical protein n=1 Tax=uncultured Microbacterium sp. TaxID=191216 RepID=UPI002636CAF5|nr:hypothetical protein [uncultured Microbacterium sp.]
MTTSVPENRDIQIDDDLELIPIDDRSWRLCDTRWSPSDAPHVVAYIEHVDEHYDVVWMSGTHRRSRLTCLEECLRAGRDHLSEEVAPGTRPVAIPHFPPQRTA